MPYLRARLPHLHINLPRDNLSLHDLLKISDVLLNNTSTAGLEASLFGIPVVGIRDDLYAFDLALQEEPDSIFRNDDRAAAGTLELGRHPQAADVSAPGREGIAKNDRLGARRMWHGRNWRRPARNG